MDTINHKSDCSLHNEPAIPAGPCDCGPAELQEYFLMTNGDRDYSAERFAASAREAKTLLAETTQAPTGSENWSREEWDAFLLGQFPGALKKA
jgi:hypothetical protein